MTTARAKHHASWAVALAARGWPDAASLAVLSLAAGLATFALVMMKHDRRDATAILAQVAYGQSVVPLGKAWLGPDLVSMGIGIALFSVLWAGVLAVIVRVSRDRYMGTRRAARVALFVALMATTIATAAFLLVHRHAIHPEKAWHWGSWIAAKFGTVSVLVAATVLLVLRRGLSQYLAARPPLCPRCSYDVRGTVAAGRRVCSECGWEIPPELIQRAAGTDLRASAEGPGA